MNSPLSISRKVKVKLNWKEKRLSYYTVTKSSLSFCILHHSFYLLLMVSFYTFDSQIHFVLTSSTAQQLANTHLFTFFKQEQHKFVLQWSETIWRILSFFNFLFTIFNSFFCKELILHSKLSSSPFLNSDLSNTFLTE